MGWYLVIVGTGVGGLWVAALPGAFDDGMLTYAGTAAAGNTPIFHVVAEAAMAATALVAGAAILRRHRLGPPTALLANGMLIYSAVNSSGWLLHNQPGVLALTGATLLGSLVSAWALTTRALTPKADRPRVRRPVAGLGRGPVGQVVRSRLVAAVAGPAPGPTAGGLGAAVV